MANIGPGAPVTNNEAATSVTTFRSSEAFFLQTNGMSSSSNTHRVSPILRIRWYESDETGVGDSKFFAVTLGEDYIELLMIE
ncbi:hypothetical protein QC764_600500 [Podospora pseudoanserina]|uniref:Uncharacterized protein n=1 Tax=Podospora pseudoanserina TaxID=2609844 RepID=A0ABR0HUH9_9PEZI|nr:hypothetical protein QC764_600500 [Podospora pseudoanserina]